MSRCDCCDLPVESCGKETERRQRAEQAAAEARLLSRGWFPAAYAGECSSCGTRFDVGDLIKVHTTTGVRRCCIATCCQALA